MNHVIFVGIFREEYPKRLGYCDDITKLGMFNADEPDFIYYDIQFSKELLDDLDKDGSP